MKCVVNGGNVKVLGKAIHSLSRVGDELYFEPLEDGLSLRTVNSSRSAYACFLFAPLFFQHFEAGAPGALPLRCKVLMKSLLSVFRSLPALEKTVERCCVSLRPQRSCLVIQLHCKYGMTRTHNLSLQECESLQAVFDPARCPHLLRAPARVLVDAILPFPLTLAEVTLGVSRGRRVVFRSFVEEADPTKAMVTEMSLGQDDFQQLQVQEDSTAITFCLKEFRGLLSFAESSNLPLNIHFDAPGRPAIFTFEDSLLEGHFVLATLSNSQLCSQEPLLPAGHDALSRDCLPDDFANDDIDSFMVTMETSACPGLMTPPPGPPVSPLPLEEEEEEELEPVPGTPPLKKFRSLFFGSVLTGPQPHGAPSRVLAEDSDGEG
ncbi:cell cycle checkpoint control protein RAD9A isoform X1 [Ornithorhynchus anatinus]|uniref:Cell cycle checkpoint control protein RAD9A n=1 Tax=Ornithorhynchus anatinus TaxID=9258 RepID=F6REC2_ORNAN|nr:cell cycle checkpoint control protein RAD9A isoform X1 [Ornithorhynchus anatinus]XP_028916306.1 cell cycle checkpoint control protein RAD9A isoform X1 [Ornithorhynchus anatinus]XP_028916307.1 cell cycle checkpoint control protein RAD9A isoform X1 [Ornithorhynchus anatinus]XP_028916308.1 cell cycle checkpoint control protein RAD9A isoform X1 [Ornithorhynchus anatinus]XP_028916309.1 cell cycle checkpoint control protein RAD9A isoform X1 [Ornithorhynchus anatinus]XP_028916310.1 cell cycle chec